MIRDEPTIELGADPGPAPGAEPGGGVVDRLAELGLRAAVAVALLPAVVAVAVVGGAAIALSRVVSRCERAAARRARRGPAGPAALRGCSRHQAS